VGAAAPHMHFMLPEVSTRPGQRTDAAVSEIELSFFLVDESCNGVIRFMYHHSESNLRVKSYHRHPI